MNKKDKEKQDASDAVTPEDGGAGETLGSQEQSGPTPEEQPVSESAGASAQQQVIELTEKLQRVAADYQNYQKRTARQMEQSQQLTREMLVKNLLSVLDDFERMLEQGNAATDVAKLLQGVQIVYDHFYNVLEGMGLQRINVKPGEAFDPTRHEALMHQPSDEVAPNAVCAELSRGYIMGERVLRPTRVAVAKAIEEDGAKDVE